MVCNFSVSMHSSYKRDTKIKRERMPIKIIIDLCNVQGSRNCEIFKFRHYPKIDFLKEK